MEAHEYIGNYKVASKIGEGSFGQIFEVIKDDITYAIKTENIGNIKSMVSLEFQIFKQLQKCRASQQKGYGFPIVYQYKQEDHYSFMVMEKLDTTLQDLVNLQFQNEIEKGIFLVIIYNTFKCIRALHQIGYLYRDVKPSNFMIKRQELKESKGRIYMIDLGLCKKYKKKDSEEHISVKHNKRLIGTPIFCSINTHHGVQSSRRDDLQSWIYMMVYLVKKLPWEIHSAQSLPSQSTELTQAEIKQSHSDKIGKLKQATNMVQIIQEEPKLPKCLLKIYQLVQNLQFQTKPDYDLIQKWISEDYDKSTGCKGKISQTFLGTKSVAKEEVKKKNLIKISFKAPTASNKIVKRGIQEININKILQKQHQ